MTPEPLLTVSEWADQHRVLPSTPPEIMDCLSFRPPGETIGAYRRAQASSWYGVTGPVSETAEKPQPHPYWP
jgi:hypothetical protein